MKNMIDNCKYKFKYKCPLQWENLEKTKDLEVRFCGECNKNIYHCKTDQEVDEHIELNHCVAFTDESEHEPREMFIGIPARVEPPLSLLDRLKMLFLALIFLLLGFGAIYGIFKLLRLTWIWSYNFGRDIF